MKPKTKDNLIWVSYIISLGFYFLGTWMFFNGILSILAGILMCQIVVVMSATSNRIKEGMAKKNKVTRKKNKVTRKKNKVTRKKNNEDRNKK